MDDATEALESAAFHAWVTLGDMLSRSGVTAAEIKNAYEVLEEALQAFRTTHGAPWPIRPGASPSPSSEPTAP